MGDGRHSGLERCTATCPLGGHLYISRWQVKLCACFTREVAIAVYTGVAATNIGSGARTLTDLFRLAKCNETSGDLAPLEGDDLKDFVDDLEGLELLVVDEISMVSRVVLAQIHARLREWRLAGGLVDLASEVFGGIAVILAGDFGQLPPVAVSPSPSCIPTSCARIGNTNPPIWAPSPRRVRHRGAIAPRA